MDRGEERKRDMALNRKHKYSEEAGAQAVRTRQGKGGYSPLCFLCSNRALLAGMIESDPFSIFLLFRHITTSHRKRGASISFL